MFSFQVTNNNAEEQLVDEQTSPVIFLWEDSDGKSNFHDLFSIVVHLVTFILILKLETCFRLNMPVNRPKTIISA